MCGTSSADRPAIVESVDANLRRLIQIKSMARTAAASESPENPDSGLELAAIYARLREQAKHVATTVGLADDDEFDRQLPPLGAEGSVQRLPRAMMGNQGAFDARARGQRALVLLGQLAGWAEGSQEALETAARAQAEAEARASVIPTRSVVDLG